MHHDFVPIANRCGDRASRKGCGFHVRLPYPHQNKLLLSMLPPAERHYQLLTAQISKRADRFAYLKNDNKSHDSQWRLIQGLAGGSRKNAEWPAFVQPLRNAA